MQLCRLKNQYITAKTAPILHTAPRKPLNQLPLNLHIRHIKKLLKTAKIEIYYVGSEENTNAENAIFEAFSRIERIPSAVKYYSHSPLKQSICRTEERLDVNQCKMVLAFKGKSDDFDAVRLMNTIFGATPFSKLFINVREKQSLCYYCTSQYNRFKKTLMVDCGIEEENIEKTEKEIIKQLEDIKNGEFSDEDISKFSFKHYQFA